MDGSEKGATYHMARTRRETLYHLEVALIELRNWYAVYKGQSPQFFAGMDACWGNCMSYVQELINAEDVSQVVRTPSQYPPED